MRVGMRRWRRLDWPKRPCAMPMRGLPATPRPGSARVGVSRAKPGEFVADELALMLRDQPYQVRCLVARARRMAAGLPTVWEAFRRGELDAEQMRVIDRVARRVTETATLAALDEQAVDAAQTRSPKQLQVWLLRLVVQLEPLAFAQRHRRALAERRVTVVQGADGIGYVTGEVSAADAAAIDATPRRHRKKPGRGGSAHRPATPRRPVRRPAPRPHRLRRPTRREARQKIEDERRGGKEKGSRGGGRDQDLAERSGASAGRRAVAGWRSRTSTPTPASCWAPICNASMLKARPSGNPSTPSSTGKPSRRPRVIKRPRTIRIGVVVPLASLLDASETPGELADRSGFIPGDILKTRSPTP